MHDVADQQLPPAGKLCLDHVAHFVPEVDAASDALTRLGFTLTPFSPQSHRLQPDSPLVPAGTGNRCVMLSAGYLEFLTPLADTPIAGQLRTAMGRYVGVHLIAFGTSQAQSDHARLTQAGFSPLDAVALQRQIETLQGMDTARFTVVRVLPGTMAEGRIQYCQHLTPRLVWQSRWLEHPNGATGLTGVLLCVADPREAAQRYARFTGLTPQPNGNAWRIDTVRGYLAFIESTTSRVTDASLLLWSLLQNSGLRVALVGSSDFPCFDESLERSPRTSAFLEDAAGYEGWLDALRRGRAVLSRGRGEGLNLRAGAARLGEEIRVRAGEPVRLSVEASFVEPGEVHRLEGADRSPARPESGSDRPVDILGRGDGKTGIALAVRRARHIDRV